MERIYALDLKKMSDKLRPLDVIFMSVLIILCISLVIGIDNGYIGLQKIEQNYINADKWIEKCVEYENVTKLYYNIEQECKFIEYVGIVCSDESIITEIKNESICVETILVKNKQTISIASISNQTNNGMSFVITYIDDTYYEERI